MSISLKILGFRNELDIVDGSNQSICDLYETTSSFSIYSNEDLNDYYSKINNLFDKLDSINSDEFTMYTIFESNENGENNPTVYYLSETLRFMDNIPIASISKILNSYLISSISTIFKDLLFLTPNTWVIQYFKSKYNNDDLFFIFDEDDLLLKKEDNKYRIICDKYNIDKQVDKIIQL